MPETVERLPSVDRRLELFVCDEMTPAIAGVTFLPEHGGEGNPVPLRGDEALAVPIITEAREVNPGSNVYLAEVNLTVQTPADDVTADIHSDWVRQMIQKIQEIRKGCPQFNARRQIFLN